METYFDAKRMLIVYREFVIGNVQLKLGMIAQMSSFESYDRSNRNIKKRMAIIAMILIAYGCIYVLETNYKLICFGVHF